MRTIATWLIVGVLMTLVHRDGSWAATSAADPRGLAIYRALAASGALDDYLKDLVAEVMGQLMHVAREWPGYQLNGPHKPAHVNVYLLDSKRLSRQKLLVPRGINLTEENLAGSAWSEKRRTIVFDRVDFEQGLEAMEGEVAANLIFRDARFQFIVAKNVPEGC
jgi:hypothetical protein